MRLRAAVPIARNYKVLQNTEEEQRTKTDEEKNRGGRDLFYENILSLV
jgi:hypothetical protein